MSGPATAGLFIYARDVDRVARFYESVLAMARTHTTPGMIVLRSPDMQLIVHEMPPGLASRTEIAVPPIPRDQAALKFFFTVPNLADAAEMAAALGGAVLPEQWRGRGFIVRNATDPEGNIFHLRESTP